jgi:hypothetical protein
VVAESLLTVRFFEQILGRVEWRIRSSHVITNLTTRGGTAVTAHRWPRGWFLLVLGALASLALGWSSTAAAQTFNELDLPAAGSEPNGIVTGPDGNLWFTRELRQPEVVAATPSAPFAPTDLRLGFACNDANAAPIISGVDTLLTSASANPVADMVALAAPPTNNGIVSIPGANGVAAFSVATVNVGASATITATANTGSATLPVTALLCESNPSTGQCLPPCESFCPSVTRTIDANETPTFSIFVFGSGQVPFLPGINRIFVQFADANGAVRGSTSVAVQTAP